MSKSGNYKLQIWHAHKTKPLQCTTFGYIWFFSLESLTALLWHWTPWKWSPVQPTPPQLHRCSSWLSCSEEHKQAAGFRWHPSWTNTWKSAKTSKRISFRYSPSLQAPGAGTGTCCPESLKHNRTVSSHVHQLPGTSHTTADQRRPSPVVTLSSFNDDTWLMVAGSKCRHPLSAGVMDTPSDWGLFLVSCRYRKKLRETARTHVTLNRLGNLQLRQHSAQIISSMTPCGRWHLDPDQGLKDSLKFTCMQCWRPSCSPQSVRMSKQMQTRKFWTSFLFYLARNIKKKYHKLR